MSMVKGLASYPRKDISGIVVVHALSLLVAPRTGEAPYIQK